MESTTLAGARYLDLPYRLILTKERRKGPNAWLALVEELPGCEARGDTAEEAAQALREEMGVWISAAIEEGRPVPRPRADTGSPDGRLEVDLPHSLHEAIVHTAVRQGLTLDQLVAIGMAALVGWRPGARESGARWLVGRADALANGRGSRPELRRAILLNIALLAVVVLAAIVILAVAVAHGI